MRSAGLALAVLAATAVAAAPASAHIQVRPASAAPKDPVMWTVLVPNERDAHTTRVELAIPPGVIPFSYEDDAGWKRHLTFNANHSIRSVVWTGRLATDGLARFTLLATTPPREGKIAWKALQTYSDGTVVRWIGDPDSDTPASLTTVSKTVPRENAGGEGNSASAAPPTTTTASEPAPAAAAAAASASDTSDTTARVAGFAGLALGAAALLLVVLSRRSRRGASR
jgi:uncharacterized protein YcnI